MMSVTFLSEEWGGVIELPFNFSNFRYFLYLLCYFMLLLENKRVWTVYSSTGFYELNFDLSFYTSCQTSFTWILACLNINDISSLIKSMHSRFFGYFNWYGI